MIPTTPAGSATYSSAEGRVFRLLERSDLGPSAVGYHSLNLSRHEYKRVAELDFVIATPTHVLVLEVKGGRVSYRDGIWVFTDRFDEEHRKSEGPFDQAASGMFALEKGLRRELGARTVAGLTFGYAVVFPDISFDEPSVSWEDPLVIDATAIGRCTDLNAPLRRLTAYWTAKTPGRRGLTKDELARLGRLLRPDFDKVPTLRVVADRLDMSMEALTEEQYQGLDWVVGSPRLVFTGGAGTGKTFLAAEVARRHAASGASTLYVCPRVALAAYLRPRLAPDGVEVRHVGDLPDGLFDVLVVDEGQDLMNFDDLDRLDAVLEGGLDGGVWRVFLDPNRQQTAVDAFDAEAFEHLKASATHTVPLTRNCRNTPQIVGQTRLYTGADIGSPIAGAGPVVEFVGVDRAELEAVALDTRIKELVDDGVMPGQITVLSPCPLEDSCVRESRHWRRRRIDVVDDALCATLPTNRLTWSTIEGFKGLENAFVVLVDLDRLPPGDLGVNHLYVGMSRPRIGLSVLMTPETEAHLAEVARSFAADGAVR